ncbi:hypothetical protein BE08_44710 [Sorangium cellulosum]|uniref:Uncharacterized protein n=1 Tax=Sorangium cellulosum TaxID=56 RepID=A0A150P298_SORCE|nr:hypothetical protein BE08_44710 [Sorangium cellulosum]
MEKFSKTCATPARSGDSERWGGRMGRIASLRQDAPTIAPPGGVRSFLAVDVDGASTPSRMSPALRDLRFDGGRSPTAGCEAERRSRVLCAARRDAAQTAQ